AGISVPSRMYNVLAAGRPILAAADPESELARLVNEEDVGWVVPPGDAASLAAAIRTARAERERLASMGARARRVVASRYTLAETLAGYRSLLAGLGFPARQASDAADAEQEQCARS